MKTCKECEHSIFDEIWGEYRCKVHHQTVYKIATAENCEDYEKKKEK